MNFILFIIFMVFFLNNKKDRQKSDLFKGLLVFAILAAIFGSVSPVFWIFAIGLIIFVANKKKQDKGNSSKEEYDRRKQAWEQQRRQNNGGAQQSQGTYHSAGSQTTRTTGGQTGRTAGSQTGYTGQGTYRQSSTSQGTHTQGTYTQSAYGQTSYNRNGQGTFRQTAYGQPDQRYTTSRILPKPLMRRNRIVSGFNQKFNLSLTQEEIHRIAEASYVSEAWKREVEAMTVKYETEGQWFAGPTDWLRVYIYAFEIQNISSDFNLQEQICFETLDEVMAYACAIPDATVEERIQRINDRYFTRFNELSFMIAYRFLQRKGRNYDLSRPDLVKNVDRELEETMKKYKTGVGAKG